MIKKIDEIKKRIQEEIEEFHYSINETTPWYKFYTNTPKHLNYPDKTMYEFIADTALLYPDYDAYEYYGKKCTYSEFMSRINRCAKSYQAIGVKEDDFVTICMPNTPEAIIAFYAVNLIGGVANMVHPLSSETELEFYINKAKSNYIVTMDFLYDKITKIKDKTKLKRIILCKANDDMQALTSMVYWITSGRKIKVKNPTDDVMMWKDFLYEGRSIENLKISHKKTDDLAVILYSGGTTGDPKGIMLSSKNFNAIALENRAVCPSTTPGSSILSIMPIFHGFGLGICFHTVLSAGMKCVIIPKFKADEFAKLIKTYKPSFIAGVPTLYEALLNAELKDDDLECITTVVCGGDTLSAPLKKQVDNFLHDHGSKAEIMVGYGMTECVASVIATPLVKFKENSIGIPEPDVYVKIVDPETNKNLYYNEDGEICISGPSVMLGYLDNPEATKKTLVVHDDKKVWLHTGDIGSMDKNGVVSFKSRLKRMIISAGYNVYPTYIENIINKHPKVLTSIVVGIPDHYKGEVAKAFIVLKSEYKVNDEIKEEIKAYCKKNIAKYSLPVAYDYRETLPKTLINKVDYRKLQQEEKK